MPELEIVASLTGPPSDSGDEIEALPPAVGCLEVRADLVGDLDPAWLRDRFPGRLLYTVRSRAEGGQGESSPSRRARRLAAAAPHYDFVDLEAGRDDGEPLLAAVPREKRVVSWHGGAGSAQELRAQLVEQQRVPAAVYKLVPTPSTPGEAVSTLLLLRGLRRRDVVAFAGGAEGAWTRLLAPYVGCPWVFASVGPTPAAPGQPTVAQILRDLGEPTLPPIEGIAGVVGCPVAHSLSPRLHNGVYRQLGIPILYLAFHVEVFGDFWLELVENENLPAFGLPLRGLSVTSPYKELALAVSGASSPLAQHIRAANTLIPRDGVWEAEATDPAGVVDALRAHEVRLEGTPAVVIGAGGAGRSAALGLKVSGARVVLANRDETKGRAAARRLGVPFVPLEDLRADDATIFVHATSLGRVGEEPAPVPRSGLGPGHVVVDLVYGDEPTPLITDVRDLGAVGVDGREVLLHQARPQFELMTGQSLPLQLGRRLLGLET